MKQAWVFFVIMLGCFLIVSAAGTETGGRLEFRTPLNMESLKQALSHARGEGACGVWPRTISYSYEVYDFRKERFSEEARTFEVKNKPQRIIPHAVGVTELLWAMCPRERIVAYNEFAAEPEFCIIADQVKEKGPIFKSKQTEMVIGYKPDLVFTVFYSSADFKEKLKQAKIPSFDLGYFGTIESIKKQTLLIGKIIGEEGNAEALIRTMDEKIHDLQKRLPKIDPSVRVLYYDEGGYIPGTSSNFSSICDMIGAVNVGAEQGIKSWGRVDFETLLKWDPDVIVVPEGSNLKAQLMGNSILSHASAVNNNKVFEVPAVYLRVDSQYLILSANVLAGIVYDKAF